MCAYLDMCVHACVRTADFGWLGSLAGLSKDTEQRAGGSLPAQHSDVPQKDSTDTVFLCFVSLMSHCSLFT